MLVNGILLNVNKFEVENPKATIIITHGIAEHSMRYERIVGILNENNYNVITYDLRGHGQSQGKRGYLKSFHNFVDDLEVIVNKERVKGGKIFLLGHSMGGLITHLHSVKYGHVTGLIISGAPTDYLKDVTPLKVIGPLVRFLRKKTNFVDEQLSRVKQVETDYLNDPLNLKYFYFGLAYEMFVKGVRYLHTNVNNLSIPVLLLHGSNDEIVPAMMTKNHFDKINFHDKQMILYEGSLHEILNDLDHEKVEQDIIKWLAKRV